MDMELAFEILTRLSSAKTCSEGGDGGLPFFAQRQERALAEESTEAAESEDGPRRCKDDAAAFFAACPIDVGVNARDPDGGHPSLYSRDAIARGFLKELRLHRKGRMSVSEMGILLGMEGADVSALGDWMCGEESPHGGEVCKVYNPVKQRHEYAMVESLKASLGERVVLPCGSCSGSASPAKYCPSLEAMANHNLNALSPNHDSELMSPATIGQLAKEMELTCEDVRILLDGLNAADIATNSTSGEPLQVFNGQAANRMDHIENQVLGALSGATIPTLLESLLCAEGRRGEGTAAAIVSIVESLCERGALRGVLSISSLSSAANPGSAIYTPRAYSLTQRSIADSFFEDNGYLTMRKCAALGLSRGRVEKFVTESFPNAVHLTDSIVDVDKICRPLENAIQIALINRAFADLRTQLPDDIASSEEDVKELIDVHLPPLLREHPRAHDDFADGLLIMDNENVIVFFCRDMVEKCTKLLMPLMEERSKLRAREIVDRRCEEGGRGKAKRDQPADWEVERELVPLIDAFTAVGKRYPDLLDLQHQYGHRNDCDDLAGPLPEFCRRALLTDDFRRACELSLRAEVDRVDSARRGLSVSARSEGAARVRDIAASFESSFRALCHLLQVFSKSLETLGTRARRGEDSASADPMVEGMRRELLLGCGSCLARLVTEFFLFKNAGDMDGEDHGLFFEYRRGRADGATANEQGHLDAIDMATLSFPCFVLRHRSDTNEEPLDSLNYVRKLFPGSVGSSLAQMWHLCSDDARGDGEKCEGAGERVESFVCHMSETCLTLVGVPFSMLDKKAERKALAARRDGVLDRLNKSQDAVETAMCSALLISHQVKNVSISGYESIKSVMKLFKHDKKIPQEVTKVLQALMSADDDDLQSLIVQAKKFGSAKNAKALAALAHGTI